MGLSQPATKVWEIPEPQPVVLPAPAEPRKEREPEPAKVPAEREKEPARR